MNKFEHSSNKSNSNSNGLNVVSITKQLAEQLSDLEKFSNNSHKQFQHLVSTSDNLSTNLSKLSTIVSNCSKVLESLSSNNEQISFLDTKVSSQLQLLNSCSQNLEEKLVSLTKINSDLASILKFEKQRTGLTQDFTNKLTEILSAQRTRLEEIKPLVENLPSSIAELLNQKLLVLEQNRSQDLAKYTQNLNAINEQLNILPNLPTKAEISNRSRLSSSIFAVAMFLLFLLSCFNLYLNYSLSSQLQRSVDSLKQDVKAIKISPVPSSPIPPKAEKKR